MAVATLTDVECILHNEYPPCFHAVARGSRQSPFAFLAPPALWSEGLRPFNLVANQRQHGDAAWIEALNALRTCFIQDDVDRAIELLRSRLSVTAGGAPSAPNVFTAPWSDAILI